MRNFLFGFMLTLTFTASLIVGAVFEQYLPGLALAMLCLVVTEMWELSLLRNEAAYSSEKELVSSPAGTKSACRRVGTPACGERYPLEWMDQ